MSIDLTLQQYIDDLKALKKSVKAEQPKLVGKIGLRKGAERLGEQWFELLPQLHSRGLFAAELLDRYSSAARRLIKLSGPSNLRTSYITVLDELTKGARDDLLLPIKSNKGPAPTLFEEFVNNLKDPEESSYFGEAIECARHGFLRAAAVLSWCAAVDRIHRRIEKGGFTAFNVTSAEMASQQKGRFKRFSAVQNVNSISELRETLDTNILWIVEGMGLIDSNEHTRLRSCFDLRNHSAHPGEAPVTEYNLMSQFSDIVRIVLTNPKFEVS